METVTLEIDSDVKKITQQNEDYKSALRRAVRFMLHMKEHNEDFFIMEEAKKRLAEMKKDPSVVRTEKDLLNYLKKRGVKID